VDGPYIGWFDACKQDAQGNRAMLDFVFLQGLYNMDGSGNFALAAVEIEAEFEAIDSAGVPTGASVITQSWVFEGAGPTPYRFTVSLDLPPARYRIRAHRVSATNTAATSMDRCTWQGLKLRIVRKPTSQVIYGDTTLVAVRIRATNGIASTATSRIRFRVKRKLPPLGVGTAVVTVNPADAFCDIMTASYGAARPISEVDVPALTRCKAAWASHNGFNGVFSQKSTVFEALNMCLQPVAAGPLPLGALMSVQVDTVKDIRVAMFTEANLNNLVIGYEFDKVGTPIGYRVEYRTPDSFTADFAVLPAGETDLEAVSLFGCTDRTTALQYAQLLLNRKAKQRKSVTFDTELEGLILLPGDRIAIQHRMPRWGQIGILEDFSINPATPPSFVNRTSSADTLWRSVVWGAGAFVAVGNAGTNGVMVSVNGTTWTSRNASSSQDWMSVAYGVATLSIQTFVAVANGSAMFSINAGTSWTAAATPPAAGVAWNGVAFSPSLVLFVAVAAQTSGGTYVSTSPTGNVWTSRTSPAGSWKEICWGNGLFVAVGENGGTPIVMTSPDGIGWTSRTPAASMGPLSGVCFGDGLFVAVCESGTNQIMTSPDGITWTARTPATAIDFRAVAWNGDVYAAVGSSNVVNTSKDGITWINASSTLAGLLYLGITANDSYMFVGVAGTGTGNRAFNATSVVGGAVLTLDRGFEWNGTPTPYAVMLSNEVNGVSDSILVSRGAEDHIVNLLEAPPFELFGKGYQESTRVAFGTMGYLVRDWIVLTAVPNGEVTVHVEAVTYDPTVYVGAMPHQLEEP
jgi:hypothetical protein